MIKLMSLTSVFSSTRRHFTISSKAVSSVSINFRRLPPLPTNPERRIPSVSIPLCSPTKRSIHPSFAVDKCTRKDIRCLARRESDGLLHTLPVSAMSNLIKKDILMTTHPFRIPSTYHSGLSTLAFPFSATFLSCIFAPPELAHQLLHRLPVV